MYKTKKGVIIMIMVAGASVRKFFAYVESKRQYFGKDYLTIHSLIVLALNYDISHNFLARYVRDFLKGKDLVEFNKMLIDYCTSIKVDESKVEFFEDESFEVCIPCELGLYKKLEKIANTLVIDREDIENKKYSVMDFESFLYGLIKSYDYAIKNGKISKSFFKKIGFDYNDFMKQFKKVIDQKDRNASDDDYDVIPKDLEKFVSIIDGAKEEFDVWYENMDTLIDFAWMEMEKRKKNKVLFLGEYMTGKKPMVLKMANQIVKDKCPEKFKDYKIVILDCLDIVKAEIDDEYIALLMSDFYDFIDGKKYIIFLDNFYTVAYDYPTTNALWQMLWQLFTGDYYVITSLTRSTTEFLNNNLKILKQITAIGVGEPKKKDYKIALRNTIFLLSYYHGVSISNEMLDKVILYATTFARQENALFAYTKDVLDSSMVNAKNRGRNYVTEEDIRYNFIISINEYKKYTDENKINTAIHEAGHFVARRFCKHFNAQRVKLISVIPHDDALGYNLLDYDPTRIKCSGYEYYLEKIAFAVAGRAAEEIFTGSVTDGAGGDLEYASEMAKYMIAYLSLEKNDDGKINIKVNESLMSDKSIDNVDERADKIIKEAYEMAKNILIRHNDYVMGLANLLCEKMIVSDKDIEAHEEDAQMEIIVPYKRIGKHVYYKKKVINTKIWKS